MTKRKLVLLIAAFAFVAIAVHAANNTGQILTSDTSITDTEACNQDCSGDCEGECSSDCDGECGGDCDGDCEGHGGKCGDHEDSNGKCHGNMSGLCGGHGNGI